MIKWIVSKELFLMAFVLMTIKNTIYSASFGDAFVFLAICGLYAYNMYLSAHKEEPINKQVKEELAEIKANVSALSMRPNQSKATPPSRIF